MNKPYYLILDDRINLIYSDCFNGDFYLTGISGDAVMIGMRAFQSCKKLEEVNFKNINYVDEDAFLYSRIGERKENGLVIIGNALVDTWNYYNNTLYIPDKVTVVSRNAFYGCPAKIIYFPLEMKEVWTGTFDSAVEIHLPIKIESNYARINGGDVKTKIYYHGDFKPGIHDFNFHGKEFIERPYTPDELKAMGVSIDKLANALDRKFTFDEIMDYGFSLDEANEYLKNVKQVDDLEL